MHSIVGCFCISGKIQVDISDAGLQPPEWAQFYADLPRLDAAALFGLMWNSNVVHQGDAGGG
jgi:hypothetical protein